MSSDNDIVTADYLRKAAERITALKELTHTRMAITPGDTVLDVGCGPGMDTVPLAAKVGASGRVFGIDSDQKMLDEALRHAQQSGLAERITHQLGSALALPLADNFVDSCRAERLLQVLPRECENDVLAELIRVTRPGGHIVLADTDWGSASVDFPDSALERRLMQFFATVMRPHGFAGRRLFGLCREAGLCNISIDAVAMVHTTLNETPFGDWLTNSAVKAGIIDHDEAQRWQNELLERSVNGSYYSNVTMLIVAGQKPDGV